MACDRTQAQLYSLYAPSDSYGLFFFAQSTLPLSLLWHLKDILHHAVFYLTIILGKEHFTRSITHFKIDQDSVGICALENHELHLVTLTTLLLGENDTHQWMWRKTRQRRALEATHGNLAKSRVDESLATVSENELKNRKRETQSRTHRNTIHDVCRRMNATR